MDGVKFGTTYLNQAINVTQQLCCDFCADFSICKSYTYFGYNRTCLLYDSINLDGSECDEYEKCQSGRICKYAIK